LIQVLPLRQIKVGRQFPCRIVNKLKEGETGMSLQTILALVTGDASDRTVLDTALAVAVPGPAEIIALHVKADPQSIIPLLGDGMSGTMAGEVTAATERDAASRAAAVRSTFEDWSRDKNIALEPTTSTAERAGAVACWRELVGREDEAAAYLGRNADLIVLARRGDVPGIGAIEACLFNSGRPVLIAPSQSPTKLGRHIGILWNGSSQAARAVGDAMPLLRHAERVTVYTTGSEGRAPAAGDFARRLSRMGITTMLDMVRLEGRSAGEALIGAAERDGVDLIVMGGYGHGRFRELILGGVTRYAIERSRTAVLLSH
jgi:nucleotide-binding universal stress UspA family protein